MKLVTFDKNTGAITGRIVCSPKQAEHYSSSRSVDDDEFAEQPELFQKIDLSDPDAPLLPLTESEAAAKGASVDFIAEKIATGKMTRSK